MSKKSSQSNGINPIVLGLGLVGGWIVYSAVGIDHNVNLPEALKAARNTYESPSAGKLSYYADTSGEGTPLVLIHSINAAASTYEVKPLFEAYQGKRPVYALDLPGFGFSDRSERRYLPLLYATAITDFIRQVVGQAADVVALSLGSEFAAMTAHEYPDTTRSLALISPTGFNADDVDVPEQALYGFFTFPLWSQAIFDLLVIKPSIRFFLGKSFVGEPDEGLIDYSYASSHQPGARNAPLYFVSGQLFGKQVRERNYSKVTQPTLILYDRDPNVQFDRLPEFVDSHPNWEAQRIPDTLGLPHWEKLDATTAALDAFWESVE